MRLVLAAALSVAFAFPAWALDIDVAWLLGHPLTRLDWVVISGRKVMSEQFVDAGESNVFFASDLQAAGYEKPLVGVDYSIDKNGFTFSFSAFRKTAGQASPQDCKDLLNSVRLNLLIVGASESHAQLANPAKRQEYANRLMHDLALGPAKVTYGDEPPSLGAHLVDMSRIAVLLFGSSTTQVVSCSGTLYGEDVDLRM